ncbi:MAG: VCBS repeat-containing protein [Pseudomonadota bacterium]
MRGNRSRYPVLTLAAICAGFFMAPLLTGCPGNTPQEDVVGADTGEPDGVVDPDAEIDVVPPIDYGQISIRLLPPGEFCGCSGPPIFQTAETLCGWHLGDTITFRVEALHTALGFEGAKGIEQVKLFQHWPTDPTGGIKLRTLSSPDVDGLFTFEVDRAQLDLPDPPDGTSWLRVEAVSKIKGTDGLAMTKEFVIPLDVDTSGPQIKIIAPSPGQKLSATASIVFTAEEGGATSGIEGFQVLIQRGPEQWEPLDVSFPILEPNAKNTYVDTLDLKDEETQDTTLRVEGTDCLGNVTHVDVNVRIIAIPRFVTPPTLQVEAGEEQAPIFDRIYALQGDGLTGNPAEPPLDLLVTADLGAYVAWGHPDGTFDPPVLVAPKPTTKDARFMDMTGDGIPDLVLLSTEANQDENVVTLWVQDTSTDAKPAGLRTFQFKEKRNVQLEANKIDLADVTSNGRPDVLVISTEENESLHVLHHTGKTAGVPGSPPAYLGYPYEFTGVTGCVDIGHTDTNGDGAVDVIIGREGSSAVTTFLNDGAGMFDIGVDSLLGFGNGTTRLLVTNLHSIDAVQDLIVFHEELKALIMVENVGNGYFNFDGIPIGGDLGTWGNEVTGSQLPRLAVDYDDVVEAGTLIMIDAPIGGFVRGYFDGDDNLDLAVTTPGDKLVRIYRGVPDAGFEGNFRQERFLNAGESPDALAAGDFNGDGMDDLAVVNKGTGRITLLLSEDGDYHATVEIPMPLKPTWDSGQVEPMQALVADFGGPKENGTQAPDGREDLLVITQPVEQTWILASGLPDVGEVEEDIATPLLLTYLGLGQPTGPNFSFVKSAISYRMKAPISGAVVGNFDDDSYLDVAISTSADPASALDGGNFDILRGGKSPLKSDPTSDGESLEGPPPIPGRFWPLGGFLGPRSPTGIGVGLLNGTTDTDTRDDIVLIAPEVGDISDPSTYQWPQAVAYISRYGQKWNTCENTYNQVSFMCCQPNDPALPCAPHPTYFCPSSETGACEGPFTNIDKVGYDPIKVVVDRISYDAGTNQPDPVPDVLVLNQGSFNFSYFIGSQTQDTYSFQTTAGQPNMYAVGANPVDMDVGDLDGDLIPDVVVALQSSLVIAYGKDDPIHHFETAKPLEKGPDSEDMTPTGVLMADVNLDGFMDIVTSSTGKSRIWIYISAGDRDYLGPYPFDCGQDPVDVVEIDWNGTQCPHLAVVNKGSKSVSLLRNERCD